MQPINRLSKITTLVFDWGNTLMKELPYPGAMVDWPVVEAVPGAEQALRTLKGSYQLVVASNAAMSSAAQIEAALGRVGLGGLMDQVFTFQEVGSRKPDPAFFGGICAALQTAPEQMLMIGDSWPVDAAGALQAGWLAAWYNPVHQAGPGLQPLHSIEIQAMAALPSRLADVNLPTPPESNRWLLEQGTSQTILVHVQMVAALAYQVAEWLSGCGEEVNPILAHRGGLLHDLAKLSATRPGAPTDHHGDLAGLLLDEVGQPVLADIARRHLFYLPGEEPVRQPRTWEEKLVYYADKLVESTRLVSLSERMTALNQRYPTYQERFTAGFPAVLELQSEICRILGVSPEDLFELLKRALFEEKPVAIPGR